MQARRFSVFRTKNPLIPILRRPIWPMLVGFGSTSTRDLNPGPKSACLLVFCTPRRTTIPGVGGLPNHPASPYSAPVSVTNNSSDLEEPGGAEINIMRPPGGTGPRVIFQDLAVYAGGPHGRPFCAAGTGRHRGAPSMGTIEGRNKKSGGWSQKYGAPAPLKSHLLRGSL